MREKTVFIGNGINYLGDNPTSWNDLLKDLMFEDQFDTEELPYVMAYEKIRFDWQNRYGKQDSSNLKAYIAKKMSIPSENETCKKILDLGFSHYITTNYDHTIENSFLSLNDSNTLFSPEKNSKKGEKYYSIRRKTELQTNKKTVGTVWHIHGEIDPCESIMLGFNHYVGSLAKVDSYLKGKYVSESNSNLTKDMNIKKIKDKIKENNYNEILKIEPFFNEVLPYLKGKYLNLNLADMGIKKIKSKVKENDYDGISWIELFFNSDVHIVGFGFDFYEIDLWNILTKRARLMSKLKISNQIYYYTKPLDQVTTDDKAKNIEIRKREMLKTLSVDIVEIPLDMNIEDRRTRSILQWQSFIDYMCKN